MADPEDRAAALLERTLAARAREAPNVARLAEQVRGRARRRRATGVVAACAVAAVLAAGVPIAVYWMAGDAVEAPVADDSPREDTRDERPRNDGVEPAPEGWRWESYGGIELQVPDDWGWGTTGSPPCLQGRDAQPYVGRPGAVLSIGCPEPVPDLDARVPYVWLDDSAQQGTRAYDHGWSERTQVLGGVPVTVFTDDPSLAVRILDSAREVGGTDANGCPLTHPIASDPLGQPMQGPGLDGVGTAQAVRVCRYALDEFRGQREPLLSSSRAVDGEAEAVLAAVVNAPPGGGPNDPGSCSADYALGGEVLILDVSGTDGRQEAVVRYAGCEQHGVDDGRVLRSLTGPLLHAVLGGPHMPSGFDGSVGDLWWGRPPGGGK